MSDKPKLQGSLQYKWQRHFKSVTVGKDTERLRNYQNSMWEPGLEPRTVEKEIIIENTTEIVVTFVVWLMVL
jgi:hypothetical protein